MKRFVKSKILWAIVIVLIVLGVLAKIYIFKPATTEYVTQEIKRGDVVQTVSPTGKIKSATEIELNFKNPGKLSVLSVKKGDKVLIGQVLAQQNANDLLANINKARSNVDQAQANLDKLKTGATQQDIAIYEVAVQKASLDLENSKNDLANAMSTYAQAINNEKNSTLNDLKNSLAKADISLQKIYDTLNYKGNSVNFTTSDPLLQQTVNLGYDDTLKLVNEAKNVNNQAAVSQDLTQTKSAVNQTLNAINKLALTLDNLSRLLDKVVLNAILSRTELDTLKTTINAEWLTTNTSINTIQSDKQGIADAELNYQTKVEAAQNLVKTYEKNLVKYQADLNYKQAPARIEDIRLYQAQVRSAQADLQLAQDRYDESIIKAPIDGVVTEVNFSVGEQSNATQPAIKMLANQVYEIEVNIPESDIAKISVSDKADITLDAFTGDDIFAGVITTIDPAETRIQDVIYYKVTIAFDSVQPQNVQSLIDKIKPGMTANVTIKTAKAENVLIVPLRAIKEESTKRFVDILVNGVPVKTEVTIGLKGDEGQAEVLSGLSEGQQVVTFIRNK